MHLHDRLGTHLTLAAPLKQAGQSLAASLIGVFAAGFPYTLSASVNSGAWRRKFVSFSLQAVTQTFQIRSIRRMTAN
jgi:hypothetical protein